MPPALKWPQRRATIGRAALCVRAALGVWLGGGRAAAPAASLGGHGLSRARPPFWRWPVALSARWPSARSRKVPPPGVRACCRPWPPWFAASASVARVLWRSVPAFFCAGGLGAAAWLSRPVSARPAPSPSVSPPFRRPLAWSRSVWGVGRCWAAPAPAGRLSRRRPGRLGRWPRSVLRPLGGLSSGFPSCFAPAARLRALSLAAVPAFGLASARLARSWRPRPRCFSPP